MEKQPTKTLARIYRSLQFCTAQRELLVKELELLELRSKKLKMQLNDGYARLVRLYILGKSRKHIPVEEVEARLQDLLRKEQELEALKKERGEANDE